MRKDDPYGCAPDWFGDPEAIDNYVTAVGDTDFVSALAADSGNIVGVALTRRHFPESAELHLIAVDPKTRGQGVGRALVERLAEDLGKARVRAALRAHGRAILRQRAVLADTCPL
jgi:ribosomal protein S18 acetylase RimI-like enzyme